MNILDLIGSNKNPENQQKRVHYFEHSTGIILPPIYKSLLINFNITHILDDKLLCYYSEEYSTTLQLYDANYKTDTRIALYNFWQLEEILENMKNIYNQDDDDQIGIENYLGLGECSNQGILLLGISKETNDKIFIEYHHENPRIVEIENNIFDFLRNHEIELSKDSLPKKKTKDSLYKKWGETFWRVNNEKE